MDASRELYGCLDEDPDSPTDFGPDDIDNAKGELAWVSCKCLMNIMWLARFCRYDLLVRYVACLLVFLSGPVLATSSS